MSVEADEDEGGNEGVVAVDSIRPIEQRLDEAEEGRRKEGVEEGGRTRCERWTKELPGDSIPIKEQG